MNHPNFDDELRRRSLEPYKEKRWNDTILSSSSKVAILFTAEELGLDLDSPRTKRRRFSRRSAVSFVTISEDDIEEEDYSNDSVFDITRPTLEDDSNQTDNRFVQTRPGNAAIYGYDQTSSQGEIHSVGAGLTKSTSVPTSVNTAATIQPSTSPLLRIKHLLQKSFANFYSGGGNEEEESMHHDDNDFNRIIPNTSFRFTWNFNEDLPTYQTTNKRMQLMNPLRLLGLLLGGGIDNGKELREEQDELKVMVATRKEILKSAKKREEMNICKLLSSSRLE